MGMRILKILIVLVTLNTAGFMAFDGTQALITGDYIRPSDGDYAGQLGPWTYIVEPLGINPESTFMKALFAVWGIGWLVVLLFFLLKRPWANKGMMIFAIASLWYLVMGTVSCISLIVLLLIYRKKTAIA